MGSQAELFLDDSVPISLNVAVMIVVFLSMFLTIPIGKQIGLDQLNIRSCLLFMKIMNISYISIVNFS